MNKIKGSIGAKILAWILLTLSTGIFFAGSFITVCFNDYDIYTKSAAVVKEELYESVSNAYSVMALRNMSMGYDNTFFDDKYFRYGIIQAESLEGLDLSDENIYVEKNFAGQPSFENYFIFQANIGEDTTYTYGENVFEAYGYISNSDEVYSAIDQVVYDAQAGIYYYQVGNRYYPVTRVDLGFVTENNVNVSGEDTHEETTYMFVYDKKTNSYRNEGYFQNGSAAEISSETLSDQEVSVTSKEADTKEAENQADSSTGNGKSVKEILAGEYITFNQLSGTDQPVEGKPVYLDGFYYENSVPIVHVSSGSSGNDITAEDYYRYDDDTLCVYGESAKNLKSYCVVSMVPESVGTGWNGDMFVQANTLVNLAYSFRYSIYGILIAAFTIGLSSLTFLFCGAGYRKNTEGIVKGWLEKLPLEIDTAGTMLIGFILCMILSEMGYYDTLPMWFFILLIVWCLCAISLLFALGFAVRVKSGKWWENTLVYRFFHWMRGIISLIAENMPMLWKAGIIFGGVCFIEVFVIAFTAYEPELELLFWLAGKIVMGVALILSLIQMKKLQEGSERIAEGDLSHQIDTAKMFWTFKEHGDNLNSIGAGMSRAVDERMRSERFKTELITNVSHDIKTPLTSIINYVDLLEKEELGNENAKEYLEVLERQSSRLKKLIEDLMEASKASTGNLAVNLERLEAGVFMVQTVGEFEEKTSAAKLELIIAKPEEPVYIIADGRHFWRVIDNLMNNICKYAQPSTRVYINLEVENAKVFITFRNTSRYALNISSGELMERFVRGDSSRNTEGSGLGLSIAQSLMELMNGNMELYVDGDLFKVVLSFHKAD